jgi:hypothetical protein
MLCLARTAEASAKSKKQGGPSVAAMVLIARSSRTTSPRCTPTQVSAAHTHQGRGSIHVHMDAHTHSHTCNRMERERETSICTRHHGRQAMPTLT